ncbi:MAG: hypothetical protein WA949_13345 [Phormidesmis sp.]
MNVTPQQQREQAARRRALKKAQKDRAKTATPKPDSQPKTLDIPQPLYSAMVSVFGKKKVEASTATVVKKREAFLDSDPEIRAASTIADGYLAIDASQLNAEQLEAVKAYVQGGSMNSTSTTGIEAVKASNQVFRENRNLQTNRGDKS